MSASWTANHSSNPLFVRHDRTSCLSRLPVPRSSTGSASGIAEYAMLMASCGSAMSTSVRSSMALVSTSFCSLRTLKMRRIRSLLAVTAPSVISMAKGVSQPRAWHTPVLGGSAHTTPPTLITTRPSSTTRLNREEEARITADWRKRSTTATSSSSTNSTNALTT